jgi:predicted PhzF superfamily epimerase YddE/YHI9
LPLDGADAVFAYVREEESENAGGETTQGVEMGRPSVLLGRTIRDERGAVTVYVGGRCVAMFEGAFELRCSAAFGPENPPADAPPPD